MAEEIRPTGEVSRGFISTARPGKTVLGKLADALAVGGDVIETQVKQAAQRELEETEDLLSSPLITEEEAIEIEHAATFPISAIRAKNRRGTLIAGQAFESVQDEVAKAPDAPAARKILREAQARILGSEDDLSVQAGIRERFAEFAPKMLAEAAARRVAARDREERVAVAENQRMALESKDSLEFINVFQGQIYEEQVGNGDVPALLNQGLQSIESFWLSGDDDENGTSNPNANVAIDRIDDVIQHVPMDDAERLKFTRLRERIESAEEQKLIDPSTADLESRKRAHLALQTEVIEYGLKNPGKVLPPELRDPYLRSATTAAEQRAALNVVKDIAEAAPMGVTATIENEQTRALLLKRLTTDGNFEDDEGGAEAMAQYDELVAQLDPNLRGDPTLRRQLQDLSDRIFQEREAVAKRMKEREEEAERILERRIAVTANSKQFGALSPEKRRDVMDRISESRAPIIRRQRQREIREAARQLGIPMHAIVDTSTR